MLYRKMPKTGQPLSALGFGCMRFPSAAEDKIDEAEATRILHHAIDNGVNYIDTAWTYHGEESEPLVGRALEEGYREKVNLATKLPVWLVKTREDMDYYLDRQLERLQTDHIDYYLLHALDRDRWANLIALGFSDFLDQALADGRIRFAGFSFHDQLDLFKEIVDSYDWSFCQIQYNILDEEVQAGKEGLMYAAQKGLGVIVMEPLRGGKLTTNVPDVVSNLWSQAGAKSPAELALRWVWNHPEVTVVLSGMSTMGQLKENLATAELSAPGNLNHQESALIEEVKSFYQQRIKIPCTSCKYCMPCPAGVDIPQVFSFFNTAHIFDRFEPAREGYNRAFAQEGYATLCEECGQCEEACPQAISIRKSLREAGDLFGK